MMARTLLALTAAALIVAGPAAQSKDIPGEVAHLLKELNVSTGGTIADIGAGGGELTVELARQIGPNGRVYSTDINPKTLEALKALVEKEQLANVVVVEGHSERTNLPDACCDGVFVRNVYHHFEKPAVMNASIRQALKPGGRFAVIDFRPNKPQPGGVPPEKRNDGDTHGVMPDEVMNELKAAGFVDVQSMASWIGASFFVRGTSPRNAAGTAPGTGPW